jgi:hypothetical protein
MSEPTSAPGLTARRGPGFTGFMASRAGRVARGALGVALIAAGLTLIPAPFGYAVAAFGIVPITAGSLDLCPVAPMWGGHLRGCDYRARIARTARDGA